MHRSHTDVSDGITRRFVAPWRYLFERREHDSAMRDARIAAEHAFAEAWATSHGEPGCRFCRGSVL